MLRANWVCTEFSKLAYQVLADLIVSCHCCESGGRCISEHAMYIGDSRSNAYGRSISGPEPAGGAADAGVIAEAGEHQPGLLGGRKGVAPESLRRPVDDDLPSGGNAAAEDEHGDRTRQETQASPRPR